MYACDPIPGVCFILRLDWQFDISRTLLALGIAHTSLGSALALGRFPGFPPEVRLPNI